MTMSEVTESTASAELAGDEAAMAILAAKRQPQAEQEAQEAPETEQPAEEEEESTEQEAEEPSTEDDDPEIDLGDIKAKKSEILAWKQGEMKDADYRRKTAEAAEAKRAVEVEKERIQAERSHYANHLDVVLHSLQTQLIGDQAHLAELAQTDPAAWVAENAKFQTRYADYQAAVMERQALSQRQQADVEAQRHDWERAEREALQQKLPEWKDEKVRSQESQLIAQHLLDMGYSQDELSMLTDHRALLIARNAAKWEQHVKSLASAKGKQTSKEPPKPVKPGSAHQNQQSNNAYQDALRRARKTGHEDDVMALLAAKRSK